MFSHSPEFSLILFLPIKKSYKKRPWITHGRKIQYYLLLLNAPVGTLTSVNEYTHLTIIPGGNLNTTVMLLVGYKKSTIHVHIAYLSFLLFEYNF